MLFADGTNNFVGATVLLAEIVSFVFVACGFFAETGVFPVLEFDARTFFNGFDSVLLFAAFIELIGAIAILIFDGDLIFSLLFLTISGFCVFAFFMFFGSFLEAKGRTIFAAFLLIEIFGLSLTSLVADFLGEVLTTDFIVAFADLVETFSGVITVFFDKVGAEIFVGADFFFAVFIASPLIFFAVFFAAIWGEIFFAVLGVGKGAAIFDLAIVLCKLTACFIQDIVL